MIPPTDPPGPDPHAAPTLFTGRGKPVVIAGAGTMGLALLVMALSILFASSLIGYLIFRGQFSVPITVHLPPGLWVSTLLLLISSGTMHWAWLSVRADRQPPLRAALLATLLLGLAFLVIQGFNWLAVYDALRHSEQALAAVQHPWFSSVGGLTNTDAPVVEHHVLLAMFYMFTILHALHVFGGLIPLGVVNAHARHGRYSRNYYPGVRYCLIYWHFLDIVWLCIFVTLLATF